MPHLLNIWSVISRKLASSPRVLLIFDYDGTLTPISTRRETDRLTDKAYKCLRMLAEKERFIVGVVSGRELTELEKLVGIPGLVYVGNHGLEMRGLGMDFVHPDASGSIESMNEVAGLLKKELNYVPELLIHDRKLSLSICIRNTSNLYAQEVYRTVMSVLEPYVSAGDMKITRGKKIFEVRPNIDCGKGEAIRRIYQDCGDKPVTMFFGDDRDDEDGFAVVQDLNGIAVCIGPPRQDTKALHQLESPNEVEKVLELLEDLNF